MFYSKSNRINPDEYNIIEKKKHECFEENTLLPTPNKSTLYSQIFEEMRSIFSFQVYTTHTHHRIFVSPSLNLFGIFGSDFRIILVKVYMYNLCVNQNVFSSGNGMMVVKIKLFMSTRKHLFS